MINFDNRLVLQAKHNGEDNSTENEQFDYLSRINRVKREINDLQN